MPIIRDDQQLLETFNILSFHRSLTYSCKYRTDKEQNLRQATFPELSSSLLLFEGVQLWLLFAGWLTFFSAVGMGKK